VGKGDDTLPKLLKQNFERFGDREIAMREKDLGIWNKYSWSDYYLRVKHLALFLIGMGLEPGDKVAILGENCPEIYWAELAAQSAKGSAVGIFSDCAASEVKYFVNHSDARFIFAHDQEQIDKILEIKPEIPKVKKVIYWDPKGLWNYKDPLILFLEDALEIGKAYEHEHPGVFEERVAGGEENDIAVIVYTSGTTGLPKAAMLSHKCLLCGSRGFETVDRYNEADSYLSFIPVAWITEQLIGIAASIRSGFVVNFPEGAETVTENIREIGPSIIFFSPRQWESINRMVQSKILDTTWLKKTIYQRMLPLGKMMTDIRLARKKPRLSHKFLNAIAHVLLFKPLKDNLGLSKIRVAYTAGSAISPSIIRLFQAIGVNIKQIYGSSEMGLVTAHRDGEIRPETSGQPFPGAEIKLSAQGEILVKNEGMFVGYYKNPQAYDERFADGWYRSGDYGYIDDHGHLIVIDRMDDLKSLKGGKKFSPQYPEVHLRASPYIKEVIVVGGEEKEFASCLVNIDLDNVGRWAEGGGIAYTTFADLSQKDEVIALIKEEIERINRTLPAEARIRKFLNMPKEFDADEAELTRTRKLRRGLLEERYQNLIQAQYGERDEIEVETPIVYRDGRKGVVKRTIKISTLQ
jgi:long-chain acyl-CoA synthetase